MLTATPDCELEIERGPDWLLVRVRRLEANEETQGALGKRLWELLQQHFTHRLMLELDETCRLDSRQAADLSWLCEQIDRHDGVMRICGLSEENRRLLHACRLDERLLPYRDRQEAVTGRRRPR